MYCKLSLQPLHISLGVKRTNLEDTRLGMYVETFKAYLQKDIGSDEKLIIDLIMSINARFLIFATSFFYGILGALNWDIISCSLRKKIKLSKHVLTILIKSKCLDTFTQLAFRFHLKLNEFVLDIRLPMHQVKIFEPRVIIRKRDEVLIPSPSMDIQRSIHLSMH